MDLPIEKLEKIGLEDFIDSYWFYLCKKTINQTQIAAFLQFDFDQSAKINHPPDNFSKCEKLYELIQKKSEAKNFLKALDETGNEHILKFIKKADFSTASTSANPNRSKSRGIWFNIPEPIDSFCGREDFLVQLHNQLKPRDDAETEVTVLSQVKIVSGLGGIGKTQTARKYIMKYRQFYNNFIWINAENDNLMSNSFLKLAEEIKIPIKNSEGKPREIQEIVKEIYNKICEGGKSNLIVFDNAEDYLSCRQFFPFGLHPDLTKPVILATSRNREWISAKGKIQVLPLDKMTEDESLEFILKQLEIPESEIPEFREESKEFIELIGGLPLALQQAVAYIKHEKKANELLSRPYKMSDYVKEFKSSAEKLQKFPHAPDSSTTVFITWEITLNKIKKDPKGQTAVELIELMSFLYADKIPVEFLLQLLPLPPPPQNWINWFRSFFQQQHDDFKSTESDLVEGLNLLERFCMIKTAGRFASIHRQVQFVILHNVKSCGRLTKLLNHLVVKCSEILKEVKVSKSSDIFLNVHQIVRNKLDLVPVTVKFLDFMDNFGFVLSEASRHSEALELHKKVYNKRRDLLGQNHEATLRAQHQMATQLNRIGRYEESLTLFKEILEKKEVHPKLGLDHPSTITTKYNIAAVLRHQEKYGEALEMFQEILDQRTKILGENHPHTLTTLNAIALLHSELGDFPQALTLFEQVEKKQIEILGPHHREVLQTKHIKAIVLFKMGKLEEASKILNKVYDKQKDILGEHHQLTINTLEWIGGILEEEGKLEQALEIRKTVYEIRKADLGEDHPSTINTKVNMAFLLHRQGKYEESLEWCQQVLAQRIQIHGENHPETLDAQHDFAVVDSHLGNFPKALVLLDTVERKQIEILGPHHPQVLRKKYNKAGVLYEMGQFEEAAKILNEVHEKQKEILGESHPDTIKSLQLIASTLEGEGKLTKAHDIYKKVYEIRKTVLGENHPQTIQVKSKILTITMESKMESPPLMESE